MNNYKLPLSTGARDRKSLGPLPTNTERRLIIIGYRQLQLTSIEEIIELRDGSETLVRSSREPLGISAIDMFVCSEGYVLYSARENQTNFAKISSYVHYYCNVWTVC